MWLISWLLQLRLFGIQENFDGILTTLQLDQAGLRDEILGKPAGTRFHLESRVSVYPDLYCADLAAASDDLVAMREYRIHVQELVGRLSNRQLNEIGWYPNPVLDIIRGLVNL